MKGHLATFRSRTYRYDERHARKKLRHSVQNAVFLSVCFTSVLVYTLWNEFWLATLAALCFYFICMSAVYLDRKGLRARIAQDQKTRIWFEDGNISIDLDGKLQTGAMDIFRSVVLQQSRGVTRTVLVDVGIGALRRFEGLQEMDAFGTEFLRRMPSSKIRIAKWIHR